MAEACASKRASVSSLATDRSWRSAFLSEERLHRLPAEPVDALAAARGPA